MGDESNLGQFIHCGCAAAGKTVIICSKHKGDPNFDPEAYRKYVYGAHGAALSNEPGGALRFDTGKPELHHIHPIAWQAYINGYVMNPVISKLNKAMDDFFYLDKDNLKTAWNENPKMEQILEMTKVLEFGAKKYASLNYAKGMKYSRVINSFRRHILKMISGEVNDDESGISHVGHIMCNYMFILTYATTRPEDCDDRVILKQGETNE